MDTLHVYIGIDTSIVYVCVSLSQICNTDSLTKGDNVDKYHLKHSI